MLTRAINALILMIAAVLIFISIQDPYTINLSPINANEKTLKASKLSAQIEPGEAAGAAAAESANSHRIAKSPASLSAEGFYKSAAGDEMSELRYFDEEAKIYAKTAIKEDAAIIFKDEVRILYEDVLLLTTSARVDTQSRELSSNARVLAFKDASKLSAESLVAKDGKLILKGVHLCLDY